MGTTTLFAIRCRGGLLGRQVTKEVLPRTARNVGIARIYDDRRIKFILHRVTKGYVWTSGCCTSLFVRFVGHLVSDKCNGIIQSKADLCVFYKKDVNGFPLMVTAVTVDDYLLGGHPKELDIFINDIEKEFNVVKEMEVRKHLGINYDFKRDENNDTS